jgi:hypothetical protein
MIIHLKARRIGLDLLTFVQVSSEYNFNVSLADGFLYAFHNEYREGFKMKTTVWECWEIDPRIQAFAYFIP